MSWDMVPGRNAAGYPDPTAATAIANVERSQRGRQSRNAGENQRKIGEKENGSTKNSRVIKK